MSYPGRRRWPSFGAAWAAAQDATTPGMMLIGWGVAFVSLIDFVSREAFWLGLLLVLPLSLPVGIATIFAAFLSWYFVVDDPLFPRRGLWIPLTPFVFLTPLVAPYALGMALFGVEAELALAFVLAVPLLIAAYFAFHMVVLAVAIVPLVMLQIGLERGKLIAILLYLILLFGTPLAALFMEEWLDRRFGAEIEAFWERDSILIDSLKAAGAFPRL